MKKKLMFALLGIILFVTLVSAVFYPEPWGSNQDAGGNNITNGGTFSADFFEGTSLTVTNIIAASSWCYQESANTSTSCGGLSTGVYANSSNWTNIDRARDTNWSSSASFYGENSTTGYFYINYTKPALATSSSLWTIKRAVAINNYTIDSNCWSQSSTLIFRGVAVNSTANVGTNYWQCYNGSMYVNTTASQSGLSLYEEAMVWRISNGSTLDFPATWTNLQDYPTTCPGSSAITQLNDSVTCSDLWGNVEGDVFTGDIIINGSAFLQLRTNTTAMICNSTNAGAIYYDSDLSKHYGCNVTDWQILY